MTAAWLYTLFPALAAVLGAVVAVNTRPSPVLVSSVQHLAAGVVFAAAAAEVLPDLMHYKAPLATLCGGAAGAIVMLLIMQLETWWKGSFGLLAATTIDLVVDGLVIGISFAAGAKAGLLLTVALTLEVLFLGLTTAHALGGLGTWSRTRIVAATAALMAALPLGALSAMPILRLSEPVVAGFLAFGLIALLYLVTEELLVEAHERPDTPWVTSLFFLGFLAVLSLDQLIA